MPALLAEQFDLSRSEARRLIDQGEMRAVGVGKKTQFPDAFLNAVRIADEQGDLVVTGLHSFAMPFVRYNLGDLVVKGSAQCECGSPFSTIRGIQGRSGQYLNLPSGRRVHPQDIVRMSFIAATWIRNLQVVQVDESHLELHVVPVRPPSREEIERINIAVAKVLYGVATLTVVIVPEIPVSYDTKFRLHRSLLEEPV